MPFSATVTFKDGSTHIYNKIPDGTTSADMAPRVARDYPNKPIASLMRQPIAPKPSAPRSLMQDVTGAMANFNRSLGVGDEIVAAGGTAADLLQGKTKFQNIGQNFNANLARQREFETDFTQARPNLAALARGTGMATTAAIPVGNTANLFAQAPRAINMARGATTAGLTGAGYAAADEGTIKERLVAAGKASRDPLVLALGAAGGALGPSNPRSVKAPSLEDLIKQKDAAYAAVKKSGYSYTADKYKELLKDIRTALNAADFNIGSHPSAAAKLKYLEKLGTINYAPTFEKLDQQRSNIWRDVSSLPDKGERTMGAIMREKIDEFVAKNSKDNSDILRARDLNTRVEKIESLNRLEQAAEDRAAATGSGGNISNATRQNIIRFKNANKNLKPDELSAAQKIIEGTKLANALRQVGKLSPVGNGLMLAGQIAALIPTKGFSAIVGVTGAVSKEISDAITASDVRALRKLISNGGNKAAEAERQLAAKAAVDPRARQLQQQVAASLSGAAGIAGTSARQTALANSLAQRETAP